MSRTGKGIVPVFDKENERFQFYEEIAVNDFYNKIDYYFNRREKNRFTLDFFIDILSGAYYAISKLNNTNFLYSSKLTKLFFKLFPAPEIFESALERNFQGVGESLNKLEQFAKSKTEILEVVAIYQRSLKNAQECLKFVPSHFKRLLYIEASIRYASKIEQVLNNFQDVITLTPENQFTYNYYQKFPSKAWKENPLAFFTDVLYGNGLQNIIDEWNNEIAQTYALDVPDYEFEKLSDFIEKIFRREYYIAYRLIKQQFTSFHFRQEKQSYLEEMVKQINILYYKSLNHSIKDYAPFHLRPYILIIRGLISGLAKSYKIEVAFNYEKEEDDPLVLKAKFIKPLLALKIYNNGDDELVLFKNKVTWLEMRAFNAGNFDEVPEMHVQWPKETFYYLLMKLLEHKAFCRPAKIESYKQVLFVGGRFFVARNFNKFKSQYKGDKKRQKSFDQIDALFR